MVSLVDRLRKSECKDRERPNLTWDVVVHNDMLLHLTLHIVLDRVESQTLIHLAYRNWLGLKTSVSVGLDHLNKTPVSFKQVPVDLVIDHSVQADLVRSEKALEANMELEFQRNKERFSFLKWGSKAFHNMLVVPPGSGIVHQV